MNDFIYVLNQINNKFTETFYKNSGLKKHNISSNESYYLNILYNLKKVTLTKFAETAKITKPAATQIINKYINKGFVKKTVSDKDKRVCYIELTSNIKNYFNEILKKLNDFYEENLSFLTEEEFNQLKTLLFKIENNL